MSKARKFADTSRISDALTLPAGDTASRPATAVAGSQRYNTSTGSIEFYNGTTWVSTNLIPAVNSVTGTIYAGAASTLTLSVSNATDTITVRFSEGGSTLADVANIAVTAGSASVSVPAAVYGQTAGDTIAVSVLNQDGTPSSNSVNKTVQALPTGGTITVSGGYRYHTFTSSSSLVVPSGFSATAEYLIVAGGAGGARAPNIATGGGGAGGAIDSTTTLSAQTYSIVVGAGGASFSAGDGGGNNGINSTAFGQTAVGGGTSGYYQGNLGAQYVSAASGGSGGGASWNGSNNTTYGAGTAGQGNRGGGVSPGDNYMGNGGGGAGGVGGDCTATVGGAGGVGINWKSLGTFYAGGGGGAGVSGGGAGGNGGGGNGSASAPTPGSNGAVNRGGGGGGNGQAGYNTAPSYPSSSGGSGIVIVRYPFS